MSDTQKILEAAQSLGRLIAEHDASHKLTDVLKRLQADADAQRLLTDHNRHVQLVSEKEMSGRPIEVADKRKLEELQTQVARNPILRDLQMAQMDYADLMRQVDQTMLGSAPAPATPPPGTSAGGAPGTPPGSPGAPGAGPTFGGITMP